MAKMLTSIKRYIGTSDETKALDCPNGSTFFETDTGNMMVFLEDEFPAKQANWVLKEKADTILHLETKFLLTELLDEARRTNVFLEIVANTLNE